MCPKSVHHSLFISGRIFSIWFGLKFGRVQTAKRNSGRMHWDFLIQFVHFLGLKLVPGVDKGLHRKLGMVIKDEEDIVISGKCG